MAYTVAEDTTYVRYQWCIERALSSETESRMPEALQVVAPRMSAISPKTQSRKPKFIVKGGYLKNKNSKRCLVMAGKMFRKGIGTASDKGDRMISVTKAV